MSNALALQSPMSLMTTDTETEVKNTARKLMRLTPGGNRLNADQATDLAVYALLTGLNPFNNECYYMDKVGPVPGIAGYRAKTQEYLIAVSDQKAIVRTWEEYRPAQPGEADFDPAKGDVAWVCTLYDSVSKERWEQRIIMTANAYHQMGATFQEARAAAIEDVGSCPSWSSVGVVKAEEHFSGFAWENNQKTDKYKPEMWDRNERAKKRAAKGCYRKGFPAVRLPDMEYGETVDGAIVEIKDQIVREIAAEAAQPRPSTDQILSDLGFDPTPQERADQAAADLGFAPNPPAMDLERAKAVTNSDGVKYDDLPTETLVNMANSLTKVIKAGATKDGPLTEAQLAERQFKRDAANAIIKSRQ